MRKNIILLCFLFLCQFALAQKQLILFNGKLVHSTTVNVLAEDEIAQVVEADTVALILPHALVQIHRDTIVQYDTIVKIIHDTINHYYTKVIHDTLVVNNYVEVDAVTAKKYSGVHYFSVSEKKKVLFSPGNLQCHKEKNLWRFAEHQYEYIGLDNANIVSNKAEWLDLFGWGTSYVLNYGTVATSYSRFVEWGQYIIGNEPSMTWRTLTKDEWTYIFEKRPNASALYGVAQVAGVNGMIILPDIWTTPRSVVFKSGMSPESGEKGYAKYQTFTAEQWALMEQAGAVFLPAAGYRYETDVKFVNQSGSYWSSTSVMENNATSFYFYGMEFSIYDETPRWRGQSVRLVKDI